MSKSEMVELKLWNELFVETENEEIQYVGCQANSAIEARPV
jgi:hypothetical protein